jgi:hypothetical protein
LLSGAVFQITYLHSLQPVCPINRFRDSRLLEQSQFAHPGDCGYDLFGQQGFYVRRPQENDFLFPGLSRIINPMIKAAAFQCVVHFPGTI